jgi:electron transfer flavoprotein beta subunit
MLKLAVLAKQVPDTKHVVGDFMKADGTLNRAALPTVFNPEDLNALEIALRIRDRTGGTVHIITMGPPAASEILRDAMARGADQGILVSDRALAGSDTLATSMALAAAVKKLNLVDVVVAGRQAIDGDTAQTGPQTAQKLGLPQVTYVEAVREVSDHRITVFRRLGRHSELIESPIPVLLTVTSEAGDPRPPRAKRLMKYRRARSFMEIRNELAAGGTPKEALDARAREVAAQLEADGLLIPTWGIEELGLDKSLVGLDGSPTKVHKAESVVLKTGEYKKIDANENGARALIAELVHDHILG